MPKENDLEGRQDMGGKHGGQAGMSKPEEHSAAQQAIAEDEKGLEQPSERAPPATNAEERLMKSEG